ncbi:MAG TPA: branched-chain amino acid ABC transporter permease [Gaiellaceae bacterium]|nr:branched-chain amino acid ABC transporter permease [Gaiellaceae bacterium]
MSRLRDLRLLQLLGPAVVIAAVGLIGQGVSPGTQSEFQTALVNVTAVIALYVFVGNSGVISFGHVSFVAVGAFAAGEMTIEPTIKPSFMPGVWGPIANHSVGDIGSLVLAAAVGGIFALVVGIPLMRLSGLAAGIATFAVLEITHNLLRYWEKIGPGANTLSLIPESTTVWRATAGALIALAVAFVYQRSRFARVLRASREDPAAAQAVGVHIHGQRLAAFTVSGALSGFAGGLLAHQLGSITTEQVYLNLTFILLAMLVFGGASSLWGATLGALTLSFVDAYLSNAENGTGFLAWQLTLPDGSSTIILGVIMALVLIFRPSGITGGAEFGLPGRRRMRAPRSPFVRSAGS